MKPPTKKSKLYKPAMLPGRAAVKKLMSGPPADRTLLDFGEAVPSGKNAPGSYAGIIEMGKKGTKLV